MQGTDNAHKGFPRMSTVQQALIMLVYRVYSSEGVVGRVGAEGSPWKSRRANPKTLSWAHDQDHLNCTFFDLWCVFGTLKWQGWSRADYGSVIWFLMGTKIMVNQTERKRNPNICPRVFSMAHLWQRASVETILTLAAILMTYPQCIWGQEPQFHNTQCFKLRSSIMSILIQTEVFRTPVIFHGMTQGNSYVCQLRMLAWVADTDTNWHWHYFMKQGEWSPHGFRCTLKPPGSWAAFLFQLCAFKRRVSCACWSSGDSRVPMPFGALCQRQAEEERGGLPCRSLSFH